ncbi:hypothetical protein ABW21_db0207931 [Orbilia brochopaga]|nr:hypothetical protein ABW21_db0207931 [Drechslerella brochopaga]
MSRDIGELPSTATLLENLQGDSKGLDIFAYLLGLQAESKNSFGDMRNFVSGAMFFGSFFQNCSFYFLTTC